jgi:hypothetical protein
MWRATIGRLLGVGVTLMGRLAFTTALCVLAGGTAAEAQVTNVTGSSGTQVQLDSLFTSTGNGPGLFSQSGGASYYSSYSSGPSAITFESGNASMRGENQVFSTSTSSVDITIKNGGSSSVDATMHSQITPADLGFYLANTGGACGGSSLFSSSGGDPFGGCGQTGKPLTFANLNTSNVSTDTPAAGAEFTFTVTVGGVQVYDFTGQQTITISPASGQAVVNPLVLSDDTVLQGLTRNQATPDSADGYTWDASNVKVGLGALAAGASEDVVYTATVTTFSNIGCTTSDPTVCLVSYAAFGDPIGKSGGTNVARKFGPGLDLSPLGSATGGIAFVDNWGPQTFQVPTFDFKDGILNFNSVPEPKTWMSLILGFSLIGAALRRRRVLSYT